MTRSGEPVDFSAAQMPEPLAEPVYGLRAFKVSDHPRVLTGIYKREYVWVEGVNSARCMVGGSWLPTALSCKGLVAPECGCGFWAYTDRGGAPIVQAPSVMGVIEAWGRMVIGPLGFRAQYARIVALAFPGPGDTTDPLLPANTRLARTMASMVRALRPPTATPPADHKPVPAPWEGLGYATQAAIRARYPGAAAYPTVEAMLAARPTTDLSAVLAALSSEAEAG